MNVGPVWASFEQEQSWIFDIKKYRCCYILTFYARGL